MDYAQIILKLRKKMGAKKFRHSHQKTAAPRVAVLVDTSTSWGRRVVGGIHKYTLQHGPWQLFIEARGLEEPVHIPQFWKGEGVIARVGSERVARHLEDMQVSVVNVSGIQIPDSKFPRVCNDWQLVAAMGAEHFLERGFRHFAYFSLYGLSYVAIQEKAFTDVLRKAGCECTGYGVAAHGGAEPDWNLDMKKLIAWLQALPKPIGIMTWNADAGRQVIYACQQAGIHVPEEVAVLCGSDDDLLCEVSYIPMSGILVASERIGYEAARVLDRLMNGRPAPKNPILIPPSTVTARQSTETLAIPDPVLVKALSFVRENAARPIQVSDVARQAGLSRRLLERRFMRALGRTPATEIRRVHLERAKKLLLETNLPIPDVADAAGFGSPEYMAFLFRKALKMTPLKYRRKGQPH